MRILIVHPDPTVGNMFIARLPSASWRPAPMRGEADILIRWGVTDGPDAPFTFNAGWALQNTRDPKSSAVLLKLNGIPHRLPSPMSSAIRWAMQYRVHMVDLKLVDIRRMRSGLSRSVSLSTQNRTALTSLARRVLYALGLHFGSVDVGVDRTGKPYVIGVDPSPMPDSTLMGRYVTALAHAIQSFCLDLSTIPGERAAHVILGADPEFILQRRHDGVLRYASDYFPDMGMVGFDSQSTVSEGRRKHPIAEVRPAPSTSPLDLVETIRSALLHAVQMAPDLNTDWLAGAHPHPGYPTGGHIHFSGIVPNTFLLRALDNYLAIPSLLLEHPDRARERRHRYGWLGDFREKDHGGFEYRTLSSWLGGIHRTRMSLCLAKLIAVEYPRLNLHLLKTGDSHRAFYRGKVDAFRDMIDALWDDLQTTDSYAEWSQDLNRTRIWIHNRRRWRESIDLKRLWNIRQ